MDFGKLVTLGWATAKKNAPVILEGISLMCGGLAVVAMADGQRRADEKLLVLPEEEKKDFKSRISKTWKYYVPSVGLYAVSVATGIGSYKSEVAKYEAIIAASAMSSGKTEHIMNKAKESLGIEQKKEKTNDDSSANDTKVMFVEQPQWFYDPVSGCTFRTAPSTICASCIEEAQEMMTGSFVSIKDIIDNCSSIDTVDFMTEGPTEASDLYGWDPDKDNCSDLIPDFSEGFVRKDGTTCIKLTFNGAPHTRDGNTKYIY